MGVGIAVIGGLTEALAAVGTAFAGAGSFIAGGLGLGAATGAAIGTGLEGAVLGGALGAVGSGITGTNPLTGALTGALTGGAVGGFGGPIASELGIGAVGGDALAGAAAGALGSGITGGDPLIGTLSGAASGALTGLSSPTAPAPGTTAPSSLSGGPGPSAGAIAPPPGIGGSGAGAFIDEASTFTSGAGIPGATAPGAAGGNAGFGDTLTGFGSPVSGAVSGLGPGAGSSLAPTDASSFKAFQGNVPGATNEIGLSLTDSPAAGATTGSPAQSDLPIPPVPPFPTDASGISTAPAGTPGLAAQTPGTWTPGVNDMTGTSSIQSPDLVSQLFGPSSSVSKAIADPSLASIGTALGNNANWLVPAAIGGYEALTSNKGLAGVPGYSGLSSTADRLSAQSTELQSYLASGTLPPGISQSLHQASTAAKAAIRSQYAQRGMTGSSAEQADLANVDNTVVSQGANIATNLLTTGINEANLSAALYSQILNASLSEDQHLGSALASLAANAARPTINVRPG